MTTLHYHPLLVALLSVVVVSVIAWIALAMWLYRDWGERRRRRE